MLSYAALIFYENNSTAFRFTLERKLWGDWEGRTDENGFANLWDIDEILKLVAILAIASCLSRFYRVGYLKYADQYQIMESGKPIGSVMATTSNGIVTFDKSTNSYEFKTWNNLEIVTP